VSAIHRILVLQAARFIIPFSSRNHPPKRYGLIQQFIAALRADLMATATQANSKTQAQPRIGAIGFCWGAYGVTHLSSESSKPLVDAAYVAHPSEVKVEDFAGIKVPFSMVIGDVDFAMKIEQVREVDKLLGENKGVETEVTIIPNARHGFAVRGNPNDQGEKEMADQAEDAAVRWFAKHL